MRKVLNIISALFLTFSILVAGNVFVNVSEEKNSLSNGDFPEDPKVKAAAITYEMAPAPESSYSENLQTTVVNNSIYTNSDMLKGFLAWRDTPLGQIRKVEILPDTYFNEDAQFEKRLNVAENGLIEGLLNIGGGLIVDGDARFKDKVTIDEGEVKINGVEYVFPEEQAADDGYVLANNGEGELDWIAQSEIFPGISGTPNRLAKFNAAGNDIEDASINDLYTSGVVLTIDASGNVILSGDIEVAGDSDVNGNSLVGGNLDVTGNGDFGGTFNVDGAATFGSNVNIGGTANMTNLSIGGTSVTATAAEINTLSGFSAVNGGVIFGNGSTLTSDISNFFWDDLNNRLGIGMNNPQFTLDVTGGIQTSDDFYVNGIGLSDIGTTAAESGANLVWTFDEFTNSSGGNVQKVLNDLDASITTFSAGAGDIESVGSMTAGDTFADATADDDWLGLGATAGRIEFDDQALDEVNILNARVGIGTTGPESRLTVAGNVSIGSGYTAIGISAPTQGLLVQGNTGIGTTNPGAQFVVGSNNQFAVNSTGNITRLNGIATSFPSSQGAAGSVLTNDGSGTLTWNAPSGTGVIGYWQRVATTVSPTTITDNVGVGATNVTSKFVVAGNASIGSGYTGIGISAPQNGLLVEGNVGIGTTAPRFALDVNGHIGPNVNDTYDLGSDAFRFRDLYLGGDTLHIGTSNSDEYAVGYDTTNNRLGFNVNGSGNSEFTFDSNGRLGIGTTSPVSALDVNGVLTLQPTANVSTIQTNSTDSRLDFISDRTDTANTAFTFRNAAGSRFLSILGNGNVGVGSSNPNALLSVGATNQFNVNSSGNISRIGGGAHSVAASGANLAVTSAGELIFDDSNVSTTIQLSDADATLPNSNIGIIDAINDAYNAAVGQGVGAWTISSNVLHPTTNTHDIAVGGSTLAASVFSIDESAGTFLFGGDQSANPVLRFEATDSDTADFGFATTDSFYFDGGTVGIGTSAPTRKLAVETDGASNYIKSAGFGTATEAGLILYSANGTQAVPTATLSGDVLGAIYFGGLDTAESYGARIYTEAAADWGTAGDTTDNPTNLFFQTTTDGSSVRTDRMAITSTGLVGIGITVPTDTLHVVGQVLASTGFHVGVDADANLISTSSAGASSTQLFIGNESILASGDIGATVQAFDTELAAIAALAVTDGNFIVGNGTTWVAESGATARTSLGLGTIATQNSNAVTITGGSITGITDLAVADGGTGASDAATARTNLGLVIGTNVQAFDAELSAIAALAVTDGNIIVGNGTTWVAESGATARTSLGLGTIATQNSNAVTITGGSITGITDLAVADGGTGASDAATARTNLGLVAGGAGDIWVEKAGDTMTGDLIVNGGSISMNNATSNFVEFPQAGVNAPTFTSRSVGTRLVLYPAISASAADYAFGISSSTLWSSVPNSSSAFRWYAGTTEIGVLSGAGALSVDSTVSGTRFLAGTSTETAPSITFTGDPDTGLTNPGLNYIGFSTGGDHKMQLDSNGVLNLGGTAGSPDLAAMRLHATFTAASDGTWETAVFDSLNGRNDTAQNSQIGILGTGTNTGSDASGSRVYGVQGSGSNLQTNAAAGTVEAFGVYGSAIGNLNGQSEAWGIYCVSSGADTNACGGNQTWTQDSDARIKTDVTTIDGALDIVKSLRGVRYRRIDDGSDRLHVGFIAQEVLPYVPEVVNYSAANDKYSMGYAEITPILVNAVQEQQIQIDSLINSTESDRDEVFALKLSEIEATQAAQQASITEITQKLLRLDALEIAMAEMTSRVNLLAERLNIWDEAMEFAQSTADSVASLIIKVPTAFNEMAFFKGPIKVNADTSETVEIPAGTLKAKITFNKSFPEKPAIYLNFVDTVPVAHKVIDITEDGFTISFDEAPEESIKIQWLAILREVTEEAPSVEVIESEDGDVEEQTLEEEEEIVENIEESTESAEEDTFGFGGPSEEITPVEPVQEPEEESDGFGIMSTSSAEESNGIVIGGVSVIEAGETSIEVETSELTESSIISVSSDAGVMLSTERIADNKFAIKLDQPYLHDVSVNWEINNAE